MSASIVILDLVGGAAILAEARSFVGAMTAF
jgi:hypothetical protein